MSNYFFLFKAKNVDDGGHRRGFLTPKKDENAQHLNRGWAANTQTVISYFLQCTSGSLSV